MIAKLFGRVDSVDAETVILNVNGVGYLVFASSRTLSKLSDIGSEVVMLIETVVKEDSITLYGFFDEDEKRYFRLLTTVQGVGAKVALALLSVFSPDKLGAAIAAADAKFITKANGVGAKLAARIVNELKDKIAIPVITCSGNVVVETKIRDNSAISDAVSALCNLGYQKMEANAVVFKIASENVNDDTAALIKKALRELAK